MESVRQAVNATRPYLNRLNRLYFRNAQGSKIPSTEAPWWQGGELYRLFQDGPGAYLLDAVFAKDEPLVKLQLGPKSVVVLRHPDLIQEVLMNKKGLYERDASPAQEIFEGGLLSLSGAEWAKRRQLLAERFHLVSVLPVIPHVDNAVNELIHSWQTSSDELIRPSPDLAWMMLKVLGKFAFEVELDREQHGGKPLHKALITLTKDAMTRCFSPFPYWHLFPSQAVSSSRSFMRNFAQEIMQKSKENRQQNANPTLMSVLLDARASGIINDADIVGEVVSFLIAGHETSATALAWILHIFSKNPEITQKCREEANQFLANDGSNITGEQLDNLRYTGQVVKETMRLYPPVPLSVHITCVDTRLGGYLLPKGTNILISSMVAHRDPEFWNAPEIFDPQRFESNTNKRHRFQYIPFLLGPHTCIGMHLAQIELTLAAARLAQHFDFEAGQDKVEADIRISLYPKGLSFYAKRLNE